MEAVSVRFGRGVLRELGPEAAQLGFKRVAVFTDRNVRRLEFFERAIRSLRDNSVQFVVYDEVAIEPTDVSFKEAARFAIDSQCDSYISIGGGSVIDTAKAANLYSTHRQFAFLDFVNAPIGRALAPPSPLQPHIACPTTCGTGSECTGFAVCDILSMKAKTGIGHKFLKPTLALIDVTTTHTLTPSVILASGYDVMCHAIESYTAIPHSQRSGYDAARPHIRPLHQGSNPYSDMGCLAAVEIAAKYLLSAVNDATDIVAREQLMYAAMLAGTAMGNAGTHLPHGMSYPVSGNVRHWAPPDGYPTAGAIIPHGISVMLNAPAAFEFTAAACPDKHIRVARILDETLVGTSIDAADAGIALSHSLLPFMERTGGLMPKGLAEVGFSDDDIEALVAGALPQKRVLNNSPRPVGPDDLRALYKRAMRYR
eukprot:TRINITY_DN381_c0_g1_i1.p1 TRINITY_DN381_c0_g1~~TRINITY_DN381_c0_g1_i1.p1  ORF type:complete len:497 (-),score=83.76 TRINITY_DN381_c0_g1_i1:43-1320(-)